jgi:anti-anti-sigma factor
MLEFTRQAHGDAVVFILSGKIGLAESARLRKVFWDCLTEENAKKIVVDLSQVPVLDSSSISLLVATKNIATKKHGELVLVGLNEANRTFLENANLDFYFDIRVDVEEGLLPERPTPMPEPVKTRGYRRAGRGHRRPRLHKRGE